MKNTLKSQNHGGTRSGSGRPKADPKTLKIQVNMRLPVWLVLWLRAHNSPASILTEIAITKHFKLKRPK